MWPDWLFPHHLSHAAGKRGSSTVVGEIRLSQTNCPPPSKSQFNTSLLWQNQSLSLPALIDSGADESFLDRNVVTPLALDTEQLDLPLEANSLNGQLLGSVTEKTVPVLLCISGNHQERISFHVIDCPHTPLILGHPWLVLNNPQIDETAGKVTSWSSFCHANCLHSAPAPACSVPLSVPALPDLSLVPPPYHDLAPVFSKQQALSLPPHRPYYCVIDLHPGAPLPFSRLSNLSHPEQEDMETYIRHSLAAGIVRPSSFPVAAGFFFVSKKDGTLRPCIDFRGLNNITVKNKYPLPLIDSAFSPPHGAKIFSKLHVQNAYHLVRIQIGRAHV